LESHEQGGGAEGMREVVGVVNVVPSRLKSQSKVGLRRENRSGMWSDGPGGQWNEESEVSGNVDDDMSEADELGVAAGPAGFMPRMASLDRLIRPPPSSLTHSNTLIILRSGPSPG
jgi:hypothetical protein